MYEFAAKWVQEHPDGYDEAANQFARVADQAKGTKYVLMAEDQIRALQVARRAAADAVLRQLDRRRPDV